MLHSLRRGRQHQRTLKKWRRQRSLVTKWRSQQHPVMSLLPVTSQAKSQLDSHGSSQVTAALSEPHNRPARPESAHVRPAKPGSVLIMPAKREPAHVMSTTPADAPLWPGLIASVLDLPLVSVRAAGIPRSAAESAPEAAPSQELAESAPEAAPSQELTESAPEAAPPQELTESAPEVAPFQELTESSSPGPLLVPSGSPEPLLVPSGSPSSMLTPPSSPSSMLTPPSSPSPLVPSSLALSECPRDSAPPEFPLEVVVFPKEIVLWGLPAYRPTESPDPSWLPEAPDLLWPPRKLPTSVLETIFALSVSCVSVSSRSQSLPWVSAPPWWAPVSSAPP